MRIELKNKIDRSIRLLQSVADQKSDIELCYSGGKDSDVILELAKMANIPFTAIYKNTTIDPAGTIAHCKMNNVEIIQPKRTFFELIEQKGFPTRRCRFCCSELKEYKIKDTAILGIRRDESTARKKRYTEPTFCRIFNKSDHVEQILPILDWTLNDVRDFITDRNIKLAVYYFDYIRKNFDFNKRLGCIGCPLASDNGISDFKENPKMLKKWIEHGKVWWNTHTETKAHERFNDVYELIAHNLFFKTYDDYYRATHGLFDYRCKNLLEDYFKIDL